MSEISQNHKKQFPGKIILILWGGSMLAWLLVLPFTLASIGDAIRQQGSLVSFFASTFVSNLVLLGLASLVGTLAARKAGLGMPYLESWLDRIQPSAGILPGLSKSLLLGCLLAGLLIVLDVGVFAPYLQAATGVQDAHMLNPDLQRASPFYGLLAALSAGVTEEVLFRWCGVSLIAWLGGLIFKDEAGHPKAFILWVAILIMGGIFGTAHLQTPAMMGWELSGPATLRAMILNGIGGLVYGWAYWKRGFESAMVAHFSTDFVLHVFLPIVFLIIA